MKTKILTFVALSLFCIIGCQSDGGDDFVDESFSKEIPNKEPLYVDLDLPTWSFSDLKSGQDMSKSAEEKSANREVVPYMAEYITAENSGEMGNTIFFNVRGNKQIPHSDFVSDSFYHQFTDQTNDISYYVDQNYPSADLGVASSTQAIDRAMTSWDDVTCSELGLFNKPYDSSFKTGAAAGNAHPIWDWVADVVHAGWYPPSFFDNLTPPGTRPGGEFILGVTITFIIFDPANGGFVDEDNNGKLDVWFREIYYNDAFSWGVDSGIDIETVALHEAGHGLSQAHFGKKFENKGGIHFAPRAVMNPSYSGIQTSVGKTDKAGHCSNWASWPNN